MTCDGCGAPWNPDVQPHVEVTDRSAGTPGGALHFCSYRCVANYANTRHDGFEALRTEHLAATVEQLNASIVAAYTIETQPSRKYGPKDHVPSGEYLTAESVPLHPLTELARGDDGVPFVRLKVGV